MNTIRITALERPDRYKMHRNEFLIIAPIILKQCLHINDNLIEELMTDEMILHFDGHGQFQFIGNYPITSYFHVNVSEIGKPCSANLVAKVELLIAEHIAVLDFLVEQSSKSIKYPEANI